MPGGATGGAPSDDMERILINAKQKERSSCDATALRRAGGHTTPTATFDGMHGDLTSFPEEPYPSAPIVNIWEN